MLTLSNPDAVAAATKDPSLDPCLRTLLAIRWAELLASDAAARIFLVEGGDDPHAIEAALGFPVGEGAPDPGYEWIECHGQWFEIAVRMGDGAAIRIFVEDGPETEMRLHAFCLAQFWPDCEGDR